MVSLVHSRPEAAACVLGAIEDVLRAGPAHAPLTRDIGGSAGTVDLGRAIAERVSPG